MVKFVISGFLFILLSLSFGCRNDKNVSRTDQQNSQSTTQVANGIPRGAATICIWDKAVLRGIPSRKNGKFLSAIALGEKVTYLGESRIDSTDKNLEFLKIRLSDGKEGWTLAYVLVRNAIPAAIIQRTFVYRRPDLLTVTDKTLEPMDMVAITKIDGDWLEIVGNQRKRSGWIKNTGVSKREEDVAVAILATKAFREKDPGKRQLMLEAIVENPELSSSVFMAGLRATMNPLPSAEEMREGLEAPIQIPDSLP